MVFRFIFPLHCETGTIVTIPSCGVKGRPTDLSCDEVATQGGDEEDLKQGELKEWDALTARLAESATFAFLLLQLPQIILNTQNLMANNYAALSAIPWMVGNENIFPAIETFATVHVLPARMPRQRFVDVFM